MYDAPMSSPALDPASGSVRWFATTGGAALHTFRGHQGNVRRLKFVQLPEGPNLVSGSSDKTVKFWSLAPLEGR